jgi:hypothetical protein
VKKGGSGLPPRVILHGQSGIGKTSFGAAAESPFFLMSPGETGLLTLIDAGIASDDTPHIEAPDWESLVGLVEELASANHSRKTLVIDTIDGAEKLCRQYTCDKDYGGDWSEKGFEGFQRGYKTMANGPWRQLLIALDRLRESKRMWVILLAHTGIGNFRNPRGPDFNSYKPAMAKDVWELTMGWADIVLFADRPVFSEKLKGEGKGKLKGIGERVMMTEWDAMADAKNRHGLPPEIDMGSSGKEAWGNFYQALADAKSRKEVQQ